MSFPSARPRPVLTRHMPRQALCGLLAGLLAGGCASFTDDGGMAPVSLSVRREIGRDAVKLSTSAQMEAAGARVRTLLADPLSEETAVEIALLSNRGLQAAYNDLGVSEAAYVQASLPPNPAISLSRIVGNAFAEVEFQLIGNLLSLATLQRRTDIARSQFEEARYRAVEATLRLAVDTRRTYVRALAAEQRVHLLEQSRETADAAARLMKQLGETGAATRLDQARVAAFHAELSARLAQARLSVRTEREALVRRLGLWGADLSFRLPGRLPALPSQADTLADVEIEAVRRRADLVIARNEVMTLAKSAGLAEATRYTSFLELAGIYKNEAETNDAGETTSKNRFGLELAVEIPVFDTGEARLRSVREIYMRAVNRLAERAINARSEARAAYETYRATYDVARYYRDRIVPLRREISSEVLLRYNGMLADVFELLVDARERIAANVAALDALRDFHLATADLQAALIVGGGVLPSGATDSTAAPETVPLPGH